MAKKLTKILVKEFSTIKEMEQCLPLINLLYPKITLIKYKKSLKINKCRGLTNAKQLN